MDLDFILYIVFKILNIIKIIGITVLILIGIVIFLLKRPHFYYVNGFRFTMVGSTMIMGKWTPFIPFSKKDCIDFNTSCFDMAFIDKTHYALMCTGSITITPSDKYKCIDYMVVNDSPTFYNKYPIKKNYITLSSWCEWYYRLLMHYPINDKIKRIEEIGLFNWEITILDSDYFDKH